MFSLLDNSAAGFSLEMEIRIYQDENLYMYLHTRLQKLRKRKSIIVHMMQGRRTRGGPRGRGEIGWAITSPDFGKNIYKIFTLKRPWSPPPSTPRFLDLPTALLRRKQRKFSCNMCIVFDTFKGWNFRLVTSSYV